MNPVDTFVEINLPSEENFLKVRETLTRIGLASKRDNRLFQTCHILHKRGRYYIVHFKELFILDGKADVLSDEDRGRRNTIANLLEEWGLVDIVDKDITQTPVAPLSTIKVLSFHEKGSWELVPKYTMGKRARI